SGVPSDTERGFIDAEFQQLLEEITDIADTTRFNGVSLLSGPPAAVDYFVGTVATDLINVDMGALAGIAEFTAAALGVGAESVDNVANATTAMAAIDVAINHTSEARASLGGLVTRFEFRGQQLATSLENVEAARSSIMDVGLAAEQSKLVSSQVLVQASVSALSQANELPQQLLRLLQ